MPHLSGHGKPRECVHAAANDTGKYHEKTFPCPIWSAYVAGDTSCDRSCAAAW